MGLRDGHIIFFIVFMFFLSLSLFLSLSKYFFLSRHFIVGVMCPFAPKLRHKSIRRQVENGAMSYDSRHHTNQRCYDKHTKPPPPPQRRIVKRYKRTGTLNIALKMTQKSKYVGVSFIVSYFCIVVFLSIGVLHVSI